MASPLSHLLDHSCLLPVGKLRVWILLNHLILEGLVKYLHDASFLLVYMLLPDSAESAQLPLFSSHSFSLSFDLQFSSQQLNFPPFHQ